MNKKDFDPWLRRNLARNLKRFRTAPPEDENAKKEKKTFTQEELSELCGFHRTYVSQVEREKANVSIDNLQRLAEALEVSPLELLGDGDSNAKKNAT